MKYTVVVFGFVLLLGVVFDRGSFAGLSSFVGGLVKFFASTWNYGTVRYYSLCTYDSSAGGYSTLPQIVVP